MTMNERDFGESYYEEGTLKDDRIVRYREHVSAGFHKLGEVLPYADISSDISSGAKSQVGQSSYAAASDHTHNLLLKILASNPTDVMFDDPRNGALCATDIGGTRRLWVRISGGWRSVVVA